MMLTTTKMMMMMMMMMETATVTSFSSPHPRPVLRHPAASSSSRRRLRRLLSPTAASAAAAIARRRHGVGPEVVPTDGRRRRTRTATVDWRCYRAPMSLSRHDNSLSRGIISFTTRAAPDTANLASRATAGCCHLADSVA